MPVNSTQADYDAALPEWLRARDVPAGEDAVKAAGEKYRARWDAQGDAALPAQPSGCTIRRAHPTASNYFFHLDSRCPGGLATIRQKIL